MQLSLFELQDRHKKTAKGEKELKVLNYNKTLCCAYASSIFPFDILFRYIEKNKNLTLRKINEYFLELFMLIFLEFFLFVAYSCKNHIQQHNNI